MWSQLNPSPGAKQTEQGPGAGLYTRGTCRALWSWRSGDCRDNRTHETDPSPQSVLGGASAAPTVTDPGDCGPSFQPWKPVRSKGMSQAEKCSFVPAPSLPTVENAIQSGQGRGCWRGEKGQLCVPGVWMISGHTYLLFPLAAPMLAALCSAVDPNPWDSLLPTHSSSDSHPPASSHLVLVNQAPTVQLQSGTGIQMGVSVALYVLSIHPWRLPASQGWCHIESPEGLWWWIPVHEESGIWIAAAQLFSVMFTMLLADQFLLCSMAALR